MLLTLGLAACTSPEAGRTQGGGPGGDTGNRSAVVRMHEGSRPFHDTPHLVLRQPPDLGPGSQAAEFSRR